VRSTVTEREDRERRKARAASLSVAASAGITVAKGAAGLATGSLALISDAAHSLLDVASTTMTWLAVRVAGKPADAEHHYGHGKVESLAALLQTALLFLLSGAVAFEGLRRLATGDTEVQPSWAAVGVLLAAIVVDAWRWRALTRVARETGSEALAADALHFSSDLVNSVLVLAALGAAALGYPQGDALVAIGVAMFIAVAGFRLARRTVDTLLDAAPTGVAEAARAKAEGVPGVVSTERVRVRPAGGRLLGEVGVEVSRTLPIERVAAIRDRIADALARSWPGSEWTVTAKPVPLDDETVLDRVMLIAARRRVFVHHVIVQTVAGRLSVSLDVEVDRRLTLRAAHAVADGLEAAIVAELGPAVEVETHIEPLPEGEVEGRDAEPVLAAHIARALEDTSREITDVSGVHSVRVRETDAGLVVNYHCRVDPDLTVARVHDGVDELERRMRAAEPRIRRLIGHAEPLG
jgi:cation diffusion facilitator family transporter